MENLYLFPYVPLNHKLIERKCTNTKMKFIENSIKGIEKVFRSSKLF